MTKVTLRYDLSRPLTEEELSKIPGIYSVYGMVRVGVSPSREEITVDYDASRLMKTDVEAVLARHGLPIRVAAEAVS